MVGRSVASAKGSVPLLACDFDGDVAARGKGHFGSVRWGGGIPTEKPPGDGHAVERLVDGGVGAVKAIDGGVEDPNVGHCGGD